MSQLLLRAIWMFAILDGNLVDDSEEEHVTWLLQGRIWACWQGVSVSRGRVSFYLTTGRDDTCVVLLTNGGGTIHVSFYLRTGEGRYMCRSTYERGRDDTCVVLLNNGGGTIHVSFYLTTGDGRYMCRST